MHYVLETPSPAGDSVPQRVIDKENAPIGAHCLRQTAEAVFRVLRRPGPRAKRLSIQIGLRFP